MTPKALLFPKGHQAGDLHPEGASQTQLDLLNDKKKQDYAFIAAAREVGADIVWLLTNHAKGAAPMVTEFYAAAKKELTAPGDAPLADLPVREGDRFLLMPFMHFLTPREFSGIAALLKLDARELTAGFGQPYDAPARDGVYLFAENLRRHGVFAQIIGNRSTNGLGPEDDEKSRKNLAHLMRTAPCLAVLDDSDWLRAARNSAAAEEAEGPARPGSVVWLEDRRAQCARSRITSLRPDIAA